jgi:ribosome biogenesis protein BMS1
MRTVAELRREKNEPVSVNTNSLYQPIERWKRKFTPMKVPNSLQARLPYKSKPKNDQAANPNRLEAKRKRGVVRAPEERKRKALLHTLSTVTKHQQRKEAEQKNRKRKEREKEEAKAKAAKDKAQKARKKEHFKQEQLKQQKNAKRKGGEENNRTAVASS